MLKLRFSQPFAKQYMDGKVSVCKYECLIVDNATKAIKERFTVTGTAKCAPSDTVDAEFGRKLADSRAKLAAYKYAANILCPSCIADIAERVNKEIEMLEFIDTMQYLKRKENTHIQEICQEAE